MQESGFFEIIPWICRYIPYHSGKKKKVACLISKKKKRTILQPSSHHIAAGLMVSPKGAQGRNRKPSHQTLQPTPPPQSTLRDSGWESTDPDPRQLRCTSKEWFQRARTHASFHTQKSTNSLTWNTKFSLINNDLLMFGLPALCCKSFCLTCLLPLISSESEGDYFMYERKQFS